MPQYEQQLLDPELACDAPPAKTTVITFAEDVIHQDACDASLASWHASQDGGQSVDPEQEGLLDDEYNSDSSDKEPASRSCLRWLGKAEHEVVSTCRLAFPSSAVDTLSFIASLFSVGLVGQLGSRQLAALTLGTTLFNITGLSVVIGLTGGMDTFCGQVYGAGQYAALGIILQRACLCCLVAGTPAYVLWAYAGPVLRLLGQDHEVVALAQQYVWIASPCLALATIKSCCRAYFTAQGLVWPLTILTLISTMLSPVYNYVFIKHLNWGLVGAATAYIAEESMNVLLCIGLITVHNLRLEPDKRTWTGFSLEALKGWGLYLKVAIPSTAMICLDWWILEVMIILAGLSRNAEIEVAAMGLCFNVFTFVYYAVDGFGVAASTRVANELGAGRGRGARLASAVALLGGLAASCTWCAVLWLSQPQWTHLFTDSPEVMHTMRIAMPLVFTAVIGYSSNTVLSGVLRGAGRQTVGFWVNLITLWCVGLPVAASLCILGHKGSWGLWAGIAVMNLLQGALMAVKVFQFDWQREVKRSQSFVSLCTPLLQSEWGQDEEGDGYDVMDDEEAGESVQYDECDVDSNVPPPEVLPEPGRKSPTTGKG